MNLTIETALQGVARALRERITPALSDGFPIEAARLAQMLVNIAANAVDDAAALRVAENADLRALFADAEGMDDADLAGRVAEAARSCDPGLRISELDRENGRLRAILVELHAAVEARTDAAARALDRRIWQLLRQIEEARAPRDQPAGQ